MSRHGTKKEVQALPAHRPQLCRCPLEQQQQVAAEGRGAQTDQRSRLTRALPAGRRGG